MARQSSKVLGLLVLLTSAVVAGDLDLLSENLCSRMRLINLLDDPREDQLLIGLDLRERPEIAKACFQAAVRFQPRRIAAWINLGVIALDLDPPDLETATTAARTVTSLLLEDPEAARFQDAALTMIADVAGVYDDIMTAHAGERTAEMYRLARAALRDDEGWQLWGDRHENQRAKAALADYFHGPSSTDPQEISSKEKATTEEFRHGLLRRLGGCLSDCQKRRCAHSTLSALLSWQPIKRHSLVHDAEQFEWLATVHREWNVTSSLVRECVPEPRNVTHWLLHLGAAFRSVAKNPPSDELKEYYSAVSGILDYPPPNEEPRVPS